MRKRLKYAAARFIDRVVRLLTPLPRSRLSKEIGSPSLARGQYLLVVLDHLGDAIMATPAIAALKSHFPECSVTVLTRPVNEPVFRNNPHVDHILLDEAPWWSARPVLGCLRPGYWTSLARNISRIRRARFDVIIDLRGDLRHLILFGAATSPKVLLGFSKTGGETLLSAHVPYDTSMHEIDKKLALLSPLGIAHVRTRPRIYLLPAEIAQAREFIAHVLGDIRFPVILMDPGAKPVQRWPLERFAVLACNLRRRFHQSILVSTGPLYTELAEKLVSRAGEDSVIFVGKMALRDHMALVAACDVVVSCDTGIAHVASAVGTKAVTLFGPTNPAEFWHGVEGARILQSPEPCCAKGLHEICSKRADGVPGVCIERISESEVENAVWDLCKREYSPT